MIACYGIAAIRPKIQFAQHAAMHARSATHADLPAPLEKFATASCSSGEVNVTLTNKGGVLRTRDVAIQTEPVKVLAVAEAGERAAGQTSGVADLESNSEVPLVYEPSPEPPQLNSRERTGTVGEPVTFCAKASRWKDARGRFCKAPADVVPPEALYPEEAPLTDASFAPGAIVLLRPGKVKKEKLAGVVEVVVVRSTRDFAFVSSPLLAGSQDSPRQFAKSSLIRTNRMQSLLRAADPQNVPLHQPCSVVRVNRRK